MTVLSKAILNKITVQPVRNTNKHETCYKCNRKPKCVCWI